MQMAYFCEIGGDAQIRIRCCWFIRSVVAIWLVYKEWNLRLSWCPQNVSSSGLNIVLCPGVQIGSLQGFLCFIRQVSMAGSDCSFQSCFLINSSPAILKLNFDGMGTFGWAHPCFVSCTCGRARALIAGFMFLSTVFLEMPMRIWWIL